MSLSGLTLCSRFATPPNALALCGPVKSGNQRDMRLYALSGTADNGTAELLKQFETLYPYLVLIARENRISDPFDPRVVEAYWVGNDLLHTVAIRQFADHLTDELKLKKKMTRREVESILMKLPHGALPHHSFHVLNVYRRTGHEDLPHVLSTMEACLINWGKVEAIMKDGYLIRTRPLNRKNSVISFGLPIQRKISIYGPQDTATTAIEVGSWVSYHWGVFCKHLSLQQVRNLKFFTDVSLKLANASIV